MANILKHHSQPGMPLSIHYDIGTPEEKQTVRICSKFCRRSKRSEEMSRYHLQSFIPIPNTFTIDIIPADHTSSHNWAYFWLNNQLFCKYLQSFNWQPSHIALASKESKNDDHCEVSDYFHAEWMRARPQPKYSSTVGVGCWLFAFFHPGKQLLGLQGEMWTHEILDLYC